MAAGHRVDYLIVDEVQFLTGAQVEQLAELVDESRVDVYASGLTTDFRTRLFQAPSGCSSSPTTCSASRSRCCAGAGCPGCSMRAWWACAGPRGRRGRRGRHRAGGGTHPRQRRGCRRKEEGVRHQVLCRRHHAHRTRPARAALTAPVGVRPHPEGVAGSPLTTPCDDAELTTRNLHRRPVVSPHDFPSHVA
ncbi:hypothetical protein [Modestobacter sp. DSM 44400]|uniref:hypothetical protein n=1 Tax=Modestobacter sp. DSM 44400 TaxID=1550230 RepID=UPI0020C893CD|nr:hypothetical protein [Modestobacter sp. DSM 44400]